MKFKHKFDVTLTKESIYYNKSEMSFLQKRVCYIKCISIAYFLCYFNKIIFTVYFLVLIINILYISIISVLSFSFS